jgi:hypothetical protein
MSTTRRGRTPIDHDVEKCVASVAVATAHLL